MNHATELQTAMEERRSLYSLVSLLFAAPLTQEQIDRLTDDEAMLIQAGEPYDWLKETHAICVGIYEDSPEGTKISYDYVYKYTPVIELQFLRGGYRLARLLNEIYR